MIHFVIVDYETKNPVSGAEVYFTDFKYKTIFDWEMETEKTGYTDETGGINVVFNNRNDSVRIEKKGYLSISVVMRSDDDVIVAYRKSGTDEVLARKIVKINQLDKIEAYRESSVPIF